jgi:hypothetical protein
MESLIPWSLVRYLWVKVYISVQTPNWAQQREAPQIICSLLYPTFEYLGSAPRRGHLGRPLPGVVSQLGACLYVAQNHPTTPTSPLQIHVHRRSRSPNLVISGSEHILGDLQSPFPIGSLASVPLEVLVAEIASRKLE